MTANIQAKRIEIAEALYSRGAYHTTLADLEANCPYYGHLYQSTSGVNFQHMGTTPESLVQIWLTDRECFIRSVANLRTF